MTFLVQRRFASQTSKPSLESFLCRETGLNRRTSKCLGPLKCIRFRVANDLFAPLSSASRSDHTSRSERIRAPAPSASQAGDRDEVRYRCGHCRGDRGSRACGQARQSQHGQRIYGRGQPLLHGRHEERLLVPVSSSLADSESNGLPPIDYLHAARGRRRKPAGSWLQTVGRSGRWELEQAGAAASRYGRAATEIVVGRCVRPGEGL